MGLWGLRGLRLLMRFEGLMRLRKVSTGARMIGLDDIVDQQAFFQHNGVRHLPLKSYESAFTNVHEHKDKYICSADPYTTEYKQPRSNPHTARLHVHGEISRASTICEVKDIEKTSACTMPFRQAMFALQPESELFPQTEPQAQS